MMAHVVKATFPRTFPLDSPGRHVNVDLLAVTGISTAHRCHLSLAAYLTGCLTEGPHMLDG